MSQKEALLNLFKMHGNKLTLGTILDNWKVVGSKYTNRISEIRRMGYDVSLVHTDREHPTNNVYMLKEFKYENGQGMFF